MDLNPDALIGIAEIAVAFGGVSALIGIIGATAHREAALDLERLKTVVLISLLIVAAALLPIIVSEYKLGQAVGWRLTGVIAFSLNLLLLIYVARAGARSGLHAADRMYVLFGYGIEPFVQGALLCIVFGAFVKHSSALYLTFLILALAQSGSALVILLNSLFAQRRGT